MGSSEDPCNQKYRGPEAFSEPETRAMRDFVGNWTNIKVMINLHTYGNTLNVPFNYDSSADNKNLEKNFPLAK